MTELSVHHSPEIRDLAYVPRWGIIRTIRQQNVAEHSYFVALIVDDILNYLRIKCPEFHVEDRIRGNMIVYALYHDLSEATTGDITGPIKNKIINKDAYYNLVERKEHELLGWSPTAQSENSFTPQELFIVKIADFLESVLFVKDEIKMGNKQLLNLESSLIDELTKRIKDKTNNYGDGFVECVLHYVALVIGDNCRPSEINIY